MRDFKRVKEFVFKTWLEVIDSCRLEAVVFFFFSFSPFFLFLNRALINLGIRRLIGRVTKVSPSSETIPIRKD